MRRAMFGSEGLVDAGFWTRMDLFYVFGVHTNDAGEALINWVDPGTFDGTAVNSPTFTIYDGFAGDGSTSYVDSNFNLLSDGTNYIQDDASVGIYLRTDQQEDSKFAFGARLISAEESQLVPWTTSNFAQGEMHGGSFISPASMAK